MRKLRNPAINQSRVKKVHEHHGRPTRPLYRFMDCNMVVER